MGLRSPQRLMKVRIYFVHQYYFYSIEQIKPTNYFKRIIHINSP